MKCREAVTFWILVLREAIIRRDFGLPVLLVCVLEISWSPLHEAYDRLYGLVVWSHVVAFMWRVFFTDSEKSIWYDTTTKEIMKEMCRKKVTSIKWHSVWLSTIQQKLSTRKKTQSTQTLRNLVTTSERTHSCEQALLNGVGFCMYLSRISLWFAEVGRKPVVRKQEWLWVCTGCPSIATEKLTIGSHSLEEGLLNQGLWLTSMLEVLIP